MTHTPTRDFDFLEKAGLVLLALQVSLFALLWIRTGFDRATDGYPILLMSTGLFVSAQRRLLAKPVSRGAARWIIASRATLLTLLTTATLVVGFYRLVPGGAPPPELVPRTLFALLWVVIALKGAAVGKLKPNGAIGLCVSWTRESRLAWDRGHRTLGRILFWGGLIGLTMSLVVDPFVSIALWAATVAFAVATALFESWRTWRLDPGRSHFA